MTLLFDASKGDFGLELSYGLEMQNPAESFESLAALIRTFQEIDLDLARIIDANLEPHLILHSIEAGSLRAWFLTALRSVPDDVLKDGDWKKIVGHFLVKVKHLLIDWLDEKETIEEPGEIEVLRTKIDEELRKIDVLRQIPTESSIPAVVVIAAIQNISQAVRNLPAEQHINFASKEGVVTVNDEFSLSERQMEELLTKFSRSELITTSLPVKKPDYLGTSMWELLADGHVVKAKIVDGKWLQRFKRREVPLLPGDSIAADVRVDVNFDENGEPFVAKYTIVKVHRVIKNVSEQLDFLKSDRRDSLPPTSTTDSTPDRGDGP